MKTISLLMTFLILSSCGKIQRIMDGTENLPNQIQETNNGMKTTNEGIRKQKIGEAFKVLMEENNRKALAPIPSNMMSAGKVMAEALTCDEALLFVKNYLIKVNEEVFEDTYPLADKGTEAGMALYVGFYTNKMADLLMVTLISGFLPDATLDAMIAQESEQGAYRDVLFQILKMRSNFYSDMMIKAGLIDGDKKLDTTGKISKAIEYAEKLDTLCRLVFVDQIALKLTGFNEKDNARLSKPLDKDLALKIWKAIQEKAKEYKPVSFSKDPAENDALVKKYTAEYEALMEKIQKKIDAY